MQTDCKNIYQRARKVAGLTQEKAAEMMGISVRSLADYETGVRIPSNDTVELMVMVYNSQLLATQHLRNSAQFARDILPDMQEMRLPEAVLNLVDAIYDFADDKLDRVLIDIARDGVIAEGERSQFEKIIHKIKDIIAAAMAVSCTEGS